MLATTTPTIEGKRIKLVFTTNYSSIFYKQ